MKCEYCNHCKYPRTYDDNGGNCKCKLMKYKTIDTYVIGGDAPEWCPLNKQGKRQIKLYHIAKIQRATIRLFEAQDETYPDGRAVKANERAIQYWLDKITENKEEQRTILDIIERQNWNTTDGTYKPICDELRNLGYEILEGVK